MVIKMKNEEFVEELLKGLNIGMTAIDHVIDKIENKQLRDIVLHQRKNYGDLKEKTQNLYPRTVDEIKKKMMMEMMIDMKTIGANDAKIAKMLTEGCNQSVMKMTHLINQNHQLETSLKNCLNDFEDISKRYIEELKGFL